MSKAVFYIDVMDYKAESGRRLRQARESKELTLKELAARTNTLTVQRISNYEQGLRYMDPDVAHQLARALGVRASWLMCVDDDDTFTADERDLIEKYRHTDRRGRDMIQQVATSQPRPAAAAVMDKTAKIADTLS